MFQKLEIPIANLDIDKLKGDQTSQFGSVFSEFNLKNRDYLFNELHDKVKFNIQPNLINITEIKGPGTHPHKDNWPVALNFYLNSENGITTIFKEKSVTAYRSTNSYSLFPIKNLEVIGEYCVHQNDWYLLNTWEVHTVKVEIGKTRSILRFVWRFHTFNKVVDSIEF